MQITDIRIRKIFKKSRLKATVSVTIDNCIAMHDIKIIQGAERLFVAMPNRKGQNDYIDIAHPIDSKTRSDFENAILTAYDNYLTNNKVS